MRWILSLFLLIIAGCVNLEPENKEVNQTKQKIETQKAELEKNLKIDNSYKIDGRYIYFYSPEEKLVKNIDVITRNEFYFDGDQKLIERIYHPKKEVRSLSRGLPFQQNENYYNTLALLTRSEVWMYGLYNNSVTYTYDNLLRKTREVYKDSKDNIYTTKKYSYKDSFYTHKISTFDGNNRLVEEVEFIYNNGKTSKVIYRDGSGTIKKEEVLKYDDTKLVEKIQKNNREKNIYQDNLLVKTEEYTDNTLKAYHTMVYDMSGRIIKKDSFTSSGELTMTTEYRY